MEGGKGFTQGTLSTLFRSTVDLRVKRNNTPDAKIKITVTTAAVIRPSSRKLRHNET
jgi:hypothetical protein